LLNLKSNVSPSLREEDVEQKLTQVNAALATMDGTVAELDRARLKYKSEIDGVNTTVANIEAQLQQALYYLDNTTLTAPEDGRIINLQVRPGMVSGIVRIGGIAAFIADADRYMLATFFQENLKYVKAGQPVEVSLDLYPGQIFSGRVDPNLARQRHRPISPKRRHSEISATFRKHRPRPVCGENLSRRFRSIEVFDWRTGVCRYLHRWQTRRMGRAPQNLNPGSLVV